VPKKSLISLAAMVPLACILAWHKPGPQNTKQPRIIQRER
jgi:hypothetical protein